MTINSLTIIIFIFTYVSLSSTAKSNEDQIEITVNTNGGATYRDAESIRFSYKDDFYNQASSFQSYYQYLVTRLGWTEAKATDFLHTYSLKFENDLSFLKKARSSHNPSEEFEKLYGQGEAWKFLSNTNVFYSDTVAVGKVLHIFDSMAVEDVTLPFITSTIKDNLTDANFDSKIEFLAYMGRRFSDNYDYDRSGHVNGKHLGIVSVVDLFKSYVTGDPAGVCRDMAVAQSKMAKMMGIEHAFTLSYKTSRSGHLIFLAQDEDGSVHTINYDEHRKSDFKDERSINIDGMMPDFGTFNVIFDADGKYLTKIPTEYKRVINRITGITLGDEDPHVRRYDSVQDISFSNTKGYRAGVYSGSLSDRDIISGVVASMKWQVRDYISFITFGQVGFRKNSTNDEKALMQTAGVMVHLYPFLVELENRSLKLDIKVSGEHIWTYNFDYRAGGRDFTYSVVPALIATSKKIEKLETEVSLSTVISSERRDVRGDGWETHPDMTIFRVKTTSPLPKFNLLSNVVFSKRYSFAPNMKAMIGFSDPTRHGQVMIGYERSLGSDPLYFIPGAEPKFILELQGKNPKKNIGFFGTGEYLLETKHIRAGAGITVSIKRKKKESRQ